MTIDRKIRGIRDPIPSGYVVGRMSAGAGPPELLHVSDIARSGSVQSAIAQGSVARIQASLDSIGSTRGAMLFRGASAWAILAPGTAGKVLTAQGAGADPTWATPVSPLKFSQTATVTVGNTAAETTLTGAGQGSRTLAANTLAAGSILRVRARGYMSATGVVTLELKVKLGAVTILDTTALGAPTVTNGLFDLDCLVACRTTGATGTVIAEGELTVGGSAPFGIANTSTATIDTTTINVVDITAQWGSALAGDTISATILTIELVSP